MGETRELSCSDVKRRWEVREVCDGLVQSWVHGKGWWSVSIERGMAE